MDADTRDISISVLGYWWWWLFVVPSLRSRRPKGQEKAALDIAFLGTPLISLIAPIATKDTFLIWAGTSWFFAFVARVTQFWLLLNDSLTLLPYRTYVWVLGVIPVLSTANFAVVAGSYGYAFLIDSDDDGDDGSSGNQPSWLKFIYKSLDFGSGRERGARN